jgi:beta-N-acetylhexosaminidase
MLETICNEYSTCTMRITNAVKIERKFLLLLFFSIAICYAGFSQSVDSLDIKIGQMILIGFPQAAVDAEVLREVSEGKVGSIIIFEKNIPARNSFAALKKIIWTYQKASKIPLFISIDQEGGKVNRLNDKYGFPRSITAEAMGKSNSLDSVRFYAEATAATLSGLGINVNFAPVVDLAVNPSNPVIVKHGRSFSNNQDSVIMLAKEFIKEHRKYGVLTSLKHFPGHGSSLADTHLGIADVTESWSERELVPYDALIKEGYADAVMTSHIVNRKLDKAGFPGTLSKDILNGILRQRLNFNGLVFSDDMQMHAITKNFGFEEAIKLTINAGVDIMTFSNNIAGSDERTVNKVHTIIRKMVQSGEIPKARIDESYRRIMKVKNELFSDEKLFTLQEDLGKLQTSNAALQNTIKALQEENEKLRANQKKKKRKKRNR